MINDRIRAFASAILPLKFRLWLRAQQRRYRLQRKPAGTVNWGDLRRLNPISRIFGIDRGFAIDRYYIDQFLSTHDRDIRKHVLEIGDNVYTRKFGSNRVTKSDVLNLVPGDHRTTIVADLTRADNLPSDLFDCIIFTQTLQMIYNFRAVLRHLHRILKPGGVLLVTTHGISKIGRREGIDQWGEYWHFTTQSIQRLFQELFPAENVTVESCGNVLSTIAFLHGLAMEELSKEELDHNDPDYELLITVRAVKP
jgi:SAM-dependent methyltransferase